MIWYGNDWKYNAVDFIARYILKMFADCSALEIGCGYGRHAEIFRPDRYLGIDFSEEMIKLAKEKKPEYKFAVQDARTFKPSEKYDIIYGVMSAELVHFFNDYARIAVINISPVITQIHFVKLN